MNKYKKGIVWALLTSFISGFSIFYNKQVTTEGIDPLIFNLIKNGGVALILSSLIFSLPDRKKIIKITFTQWKKLLFIGLIGGSIPFVLFFEGLKQASAVNASFIHKTMFIWIAMLAIPFLGEKLNFWQIIGYFSVILGNFFIGSFSGPNFNIGELMILSATLFWAVENVTAKILFKEIDYKIVAWGRMFFGSLILLSIAIFQNKLSLLINISPDKLPVCFGSILFLTFYVLTLFKALNNAPATLVTSILILSVPITNILNVIFITRFLPQTQLLNLIFVLSGLILINHFTSSFKHTHYQAKTR